jgi:glycosyltransferase involved in cell wall biosynthesis
MRILWMKPILPYPPTQGTRRVTLQLLQNLVPQHTVRLFARRLAASETTAVHDLEARVPGLEVSAPLAPNRASTLHRALYRFRTRAATRRGSPPIETYTCLPPLLDAFAGEVDRFHPDLVVVEYWYAAPYLARVPHLPRVLFAHDIEYAARRRAAAFLQEGSRAPEWAELEETREKAALSGAPFTWYLTEADRNEALTALGIEPGRTGIVPYGLDLQGALAPPGPGDPAEDPERVLFFGSFAADFNRDALDFILNAVWPEIRRRRPSARLAVAGGGLPPGAARRVRASGGEVLGEVSEVRSAVLTAAVVLVPLRYGGGLRIRLLESLALGRAVIGTPVGVLGMGPRAEEEVLVAEDPGELAELVVRALGDPALRRELGARGRSWVERHHDREAAARSQRELVTRTLDRLR